MINLKSILFLVVLVSTRILAQDKPITIEVRESNKELGGAMHNALLVTIYEAEKNDIEKAWKNKMKKYDAKVSSKKEIFADNAVINELGNNTIDLYAAIQEDGDKKHTLMVAIDLGGAYLSSTTHSSQYTAMKNILYGFAVNLTKEAIAGQAKAAEKVLAGLENDQKDLIKSKENLQEDIADYKQKIYYRK